MSLPLIFYHPLSLLYAFEDEKKSFKYILEIDLKAGF